MICGPPPRPFRWNDQFVDGCDRYYGNTVDAVHNEGEFAHATSFECVREGVEGLELELFDAFESTPTCDDIEGFYECQVRRVINTPQSVTIIVCASTSDVLARRSATASSAIILRL